MLKSPDRTVLLIATRIWLARSCAVVFPAVLAAVIADERSIDATLARERGPSLYDARNRLVVSLQYALPAPPARSFSASVPEYRT